MLTYQALACLRKGEHGWASAPPSDGDGVTVVTVDYPPVNALPVQGWFDLADAIGDAGRDPPTHAVVLRAEGRGFNAGVDIKEMQRTAGFDALIGANRGCYAAFAAVYDCAVPVIAAVQGFCLGGGIGLVGNADVVVASDDATFGLPEVDRGALGAATHLARLVPQHLMRALYFTASTVDAADAAPLRLGLSRRAARRAGRRRARRRARHRRQGHPGHPGRQGGAQRHRRASTCTAATASSRASPSS